MKFSIYRYNPEIDKKPRMQDYYLDLRKVPGKMLLDALIMLKEQDPSLSFRRSCREGVCGSDGMNINGKNGLACITPLESLRHCDAIALRPLSGMPVVRDLIVNMDNFYKQYEKSKPYLQNSGPTPATERLQTPKQRAKLDGLYECIMCGCCSSSCPSYWWNPEKFLGPQAAISAGMRIMDSRDDKTQERLKDLDDGYSLLRCRSIMSCVDACPKNLNPTR
ncbi:MAG: succinate dehydrogenase iron-sulfur subunit, partial [Legionellales bacterium]